MNEKDQEKKPRKKRTAWVHILLFPDERVVWQSMAQEAGMCLADFIRQRMGQPVLQRSRPAPKRRSPPVADPELIRQLAWLGNNLNQIAHRVNERSLTGIEVLVCLAEIERDLMRILNGPH
jgi:hypothetical protein